MTSGVIVASNVLCSAGSSTQQLWAAVRAGISRIGNSHIIGRDREPIRMGLVPEDALEPHLPPEIELLPLPSRARRMLRLAAPVLRSVLEHAGDSPVRLFLGLPQLTVSEAPWLKGFALYLGKCAGVALDAPNSRVVPSGRAAAMMALELALNALDSDPTRPVIVGGVDTFLDLKLLAALDAEGRILGSNVMDGFLPGEGAAFLVLSHPSLAGESGVASISARAAASFSDGGHRTGPEPARGEGLAEAIDTLRSRLTGAVPAVATTFAGLNGESFDAKLWGVARVRHAGFFAPSMVLEHPADCCGDAGAALGAILLALAATALKDRQRAGPALVWAASDGESRACALLSASRASSTPGEV